MVCCEAKGFNMTQFRNSLSNNFSIGGTHNTIAVKHAFGFVSEPFHDLTARPYGIFQLTRCASSQIVKDHSRTVGRGASRTQSFAEVDDATDGVGFFDVAGKDPRDDMADMLQSFPSFVEREKQRTEFRDGFHRKDTREAVLGIIKTDLADIKVDLRPLQTKDFLTTPTCVVTKEKRSAEIFRQVSSDGSNLLIVEETFASRWLFQLFEGRQRLNFTKTQGFHDDFQFAIDRCIRCLFGLSSRSIFQKVIVCNPIGANVAKPLFDVIQPAVERWCRAIMMDFIILLDQIQQFVEGLTVIAFTLVERVLQFLQLTAGIGWWYRFTILRFPVMLDLRRLTLQLATPSPHEVPSVAS